MLLQCKGGGGEGRTSFCCCTEGNDGSDLVTGIWLCLFYAILVINLICWEDSLLIYLACSLSCCPLVLFKMLSLMYVALLNSLFEYMEVFSFENTVYWLDTWTQLNRPQICWRHYINNLISVHSLVLAGGSLSTDTLSITCRLPHLPFRAFFPGRSSGGSSSPGGPITLPALALGLPFVSCCWQFWTLVLHLFLQAWDVFFL